MAAYMHGNLAVEESIRPRETASQKRKLVYRRKAIPVQEKLLYLFTIAVCVFVAGVIIWRYAQIYEVNTQIQQIQNQIEALQDENKSLKLEVMQLQDPKRLIEEGKALGLRPSSDGEIAEVPLESDISQLQDRVALNQ